MNVMEEIIVGTPDWYDFIEDAEVVSIFEAKDGPNVIVALVYADSPAGPGGCTLCVSMSVQDPLAAPTIKVKPWMLEQLAAPADLADEVLDVRGTFLEGVKPGGMHQVTFAEQHPSTGSAVLRLAALAHANATGRLLDPLDLSKNLVILDSVTSSE